MLTIVQAVSLKSSLREKIRSYSKNSLLLTYLVVVLAGDVVDLEGVLWGVDGWVYVVVVDLQQILKAGLHLQLHICLGEVLE